MEKLEQIFLTKFQSIIMSNSQMKSFMENFVQSIFIGVAGGNLITLQRLVLEFRMFELFNN